MKDIYWIKKYKYKYSHKQLYKLKKNLIKNYTSSKYLSYYLKSLFGVYLFAKAIEAGRKIMRHFIKKFIKIEINFKCNKPISAKSNGIRMGKGKGHLEEWVKVLKKGEVIYTLLNLNYYQSFFLLRKSRKKFCFKTIVGQNLLKKNFLVNTNLYY